MSVCLYRADEESAGAPSTNVKLRYNGEIVWDSPAITKSTCVVDVSYFPFDWQQCNLTFGSWTYNGNQVCSSRSGRWMTERHILGLFWWLNSTATAALKRVFVPVHTQTSFSNISIIHSMQSPWILVLIIFNYFYQQYKSCYCILKCLCNVVNY